MKKYTSFLFGFGICLLGIIVFSFTGNKQLDLAYVNNQLLFQEFQLTKDLKTDFDKEFSKRKAVIDSLQVELTLLQQQLVNHPEKSIEQKFMLIEREYALRKQRFEQESTEVNEKYQSQILSQLNQYMSLFGKEVNVKLLLGANGNGEIMYADSTIDYTKKAIEFINKKYAGK